MDFVDLGRTLDLLDGETALLGIAYKRAGGARLLGCTRGELHVFTQEELDAWFDESGQTPSPPPTPGERAHYFRVGDFELAISNRQYVGSGYEAQILTIQTGPMLLQLDFTKEPTDV
jgi:hypothetical protein